LRIKAERIALPLFDLLRDIYPLNRVLWTKAICELEDVPLKLFGEVNELGERG
jgi:hypothetical protein